MFERMPFSKFEENTKIALKFEFELGLIKIGFK